MQELIQNYKKIKITKKYKKLLNLIIHQTVMLLMISMEKIIMR